MRTFSCLLLATFATVLRLSLCGNFGIRAPSIFRAQESDMHKYAAILAATEPFKKLLDEQIKQALNPLSSLCYQLKGKPISYAMNQRPRNREIDAALTKYEERLSNVLRSYGMHTADFNTISADACKVPTLKRRLLLQAYYYKIAADLESNLRLSLPNIPVDNVYNGYNMETPPDYSILTKRTNGAETKLQKFSRTLRTIESERLNRRDFIKRELGLASLPRRVVDPQIQGAMSDSIQRVYNDFPLIAERIVSQNGLGRDEFEELRNKFNRNPLYRLMVYREVNKQEKLDTKMGVRGGS